MFCRIFLERKAPGLIIKDDQFLAFDQDIIDRSKEDITFLVFPADAFKVASPDLHQFLVVKELTVVVAFRVF